MTKFTLYYPSFVEKDSPESTEFNSLDDLRKDPVIRNRMFADTGELIDTFAYGTLKPGAFDGNRYYIHVFHKTQMYSSNKMAYLGAAIITGNTTEEITAALELLGTVAVPKEKW